MLHHQHRAQIARAQANSAHNSTDEELQRERQRIANCNARLRKRFGITDSPAQKQVEISQPNDPYEKEADEVADKVVSGEEKEVSSNSLPANISRKEEETLMAKSEDNTLQGTEHLQANLENIKGAGQALDDETKAEMEEKMNADLSDVRIHTGQNAHQMSEGINAKAFTHGQDVYFKNGNYDPKSDEGRKLLAHELAHTQQQKGGVGRKVQRVKDKTLADIPEADRKTTKVFNGIYSVSDRIHDYFDHSITYLPNPADTIKNIYLPASLNTAFHHGFNNLVHQQLFSVVSYGGEKYSATLGIDFSLIDYSTLGLDKASADALKAQYGSSVKVFRFTGAAEAANTVDSMVVEDMGELKKYSKADDDTKAAWQKKFDEMQFSFSNELDPWQEDEKEFVLKAIYSAPNSQLAAIKGIKFLRDISERLNNNNEAASYSTDHTLKVKNWAFHDQSSMFGTSLDSKIKSRCINPAVDDPLTEAYTPEPTDLVYGTKNFFSSLDNSIFHEIGHAIDQANLVAIKNEYYAGFDAYKEEDHRYALKLIELKKMDSNTEMSLTITEKDGKKSASWSFRGTNSALLAKLNEAKDQHKSLRDAITKSIDDKGVEFSNTYSESGGRKGVVEKRGSIRFEDANLETPFIKATKADGGKSITNYAGKTTLEHFAEAYALYLSDPEKLELLRPNVYAYFKSTILPSPRTKNK